MKWNEEEEEIRSEARASVRETLKSELCFRLLLSPTRCWFYIFIVGSYIYPYLYTFNLSTNSFSSPSFFDFASRDNARQTAMMREENIACVHKDGVFVFSERARSLDEANYEFGAREREGAR